MSTEIMLLLLMLAVFLPFVLWLKLPVGLSLAATSVIVAVAGGEGFPLRHLVEGMFGYLDVSLVLITAMIFMKVIEKNGLLNALARDLILKFGRSPLALLAVMTLIIMFPGAITGSCTASVLSTGVLMLPVLAQMNMPRHQAGAIIAMASVYGMIAPPVNIIVMIIGGGIDMPYIGFDLILLLITVPLAVLTTIYLGYGYARKVDLKAAVASLHGRETGGGWLLYMPLLVVAVLMIGPKAMPQLFPDPRLPLTFVIGSILGLFVGKKFPVLDAARQAVSEILPVVGILMGIGMLIQIMTLTGHSRRHRHQQPEPARVPAALEHCREPAAFRRHFRLRGLQHSGGAVHPDVSGAEPDRHRLGPVAHRRHGKLYPAGGADGRHCRPGGRRAELFQSRSAVDSAVARRHPHRGGADRLCRPGGETDRIVTGC